MGKVEGGLREVGRKVKAVIKVFNLYGVRMRLLYVYKAYHALQADVSFSVFTSGETLVSSVLYITFGVIYYVKSR